MKFYRSAAFLQAVGEGLYAGADLVRAEASHSITRGSASGKRHVPSAPGLPPNNDTGVLKAHITNERVDAFTARVTSNAPYAAALEFGTSKMAARPYLRPARDKCRERAEREVVKAIEKARRKFNGGS
ncbi:HK97-gp10 family putative phage morphogenesis protein [Novosphingobium sp.]|uniref:HK97-gp10 family putative phage morphogenesis protein n=1 Tax=Novosphingobium sp. TaxID=1874826 RepID=UPI00262D375C|nr:HK97-gp10 family putative phage morphogenesis protein [Novosphingobium sp.]